MSRSPASDPEEPFHLGVTLDTLDGRCVLAASTKRDGEDPITRRDPILHSAPGPVAAHRVRHLSHLRLPPRRERALHPRPGDRHRGRALRVAGVDAVVDRASSTTGSVGERRLGS